MDFSLSPAAQDAEISGWSPVIAPEAINCQAPDTGNMELLHMRDGDEYMVTGRKWRITGGSITPCGPSGWPSGPSR